jgi:Alpha/beta hydrolase of unknown function (DUF900)
VPVFREKVLGPNHPSVATSLTNFAVLYRAQGRYSDADLLRKRTEAMPGWEVVDVPILFATNRAAEFASGRTTFGAKQEADIQEIVFGKGTVRAPKSEVLNRANRLAQALGQLHRAAGRQTFASGLAVHSVERNECGVEFAAVARDQLSRAARFPEQAFIFVHGYNNSFEDAVQRTAMIAFNLDFDGAAFLFTWPSQEKLAGHDLDRKRARIAAPFLLALLEKIGTALPDVKLHLIAHVYITKTSETSRADPVWKMRLVEGPSAGYSGGGRSKHRADQRSCFECDEAVNLCNDGRNHRWNTPASSSHCLPRPRHSLALAYGSG